MKISIAIALLLGYASVEASPSLRRLVYTPTEETAGEFGKTAPLDPIVEELQLEINHRILQLSMSMATTTATASVLPKDLTAPIINLSGEAPVSKSKPGAIVDTSDQNSVLVDFETGEVSENELPTVTSDSPETKEDTVSKPQDPQVSGAETSANTPDSTHIKPEKTRKVNTEAIIAIAVVCVGSVATALGLIRKRRQQRYNQFSSPSVDFA